jgi:uncharacterized protein (TIGR02246 family)
MRTLIILAVAASAVVLTGCDKAAESKVDTASIEKQIRDLETQWGKDYDSKNAEGLAGHYANDAAIANPGMALATDTATRREAIDGFIADPALNIKFASDRIEVAGSGDLASSRGHYTMTYTDPETKKPKTENGSYLTVYRKQTDGSWKAVEDFVTPGAAETASK